MDQLAKLDEETSQSAKEEELEFEEKTPPPKKKLSLFDTMAVLSQLDDAQSSGKE